jgi:hypothetical protein
VVSASGGRWAEQHIDPLARGLHPWCGVVLERLEENAVRGLL